jgi:hypothetical protein
LILQGRTGPALSTDYRILGFIARRLPSVNTINSVFLPFVLCMIIRDTLPAAKKYGKHRMAVSKNKMHDGSYEFYGRAGE